MGQEIVYCVQCASRIGGADFGKGLAFRVSGKIVCAKCLPMVSPTLTPAEQKAVAPPPGGRKNSTSRIKMLKASPGPGTSARLAPVRVEEAPRSRMPLIIGGVIAVVVLVVAGVYLSSGPAPSPEETAAVKPVAPKPSAPPVEEKREDPLIREAREAIEHARAKAKEAPKDWDAQLAAWEEAARKAALTPLFKEAAAGVQETRERIAAAKPAQVVVEKPPAPAETAPKGPSSEAKAYLSRWEPAMTKAAARDFDGAIADLGRAAAEISDEQVKRDAAVDIADLQRARVLVDEAVALLAKTPRGQALSVTVRGDSGERKKVEGSVVRSGPARAELRQGDASVFVEWSDVGAPSLAAALRPTAEADRRALAILCLLEGDREAAERVLSGPAEGISARAWDYARDAAAKLPKVSPRENEARKLFYGAEREFGKMETLPAAVAKYKSLADDYADTRVVKGELLRIQKRSEAGRDYVLLAGALKGSGTFAAGPAPRVELAWGSKADSDPSVENCVEGDFAALPDVVYRAWALVGGCCGETFTFFLQTSEGTDLHPKTKQKTSIEPGAGFATLVKHSIPGLKKTHEDHKIKGSKTHPKIAARWEWVAIPLPKYAGPGVKKIRLISDQQGFAVGAVVVSATRSAPPSDDVLKDEVERARAAGETEAPAPAGKAWRPIFDGKSLDCLRSNGDGWRLENGAIAHISGPGNAAQTREEFEDVEIRIRFELKDLDSAYFKLRQGSGGGYAVGIDGASVKGLEGKPHEIIFTAKGDQVTATLDGKTYSIVSEGPAKRGCLQFNGNGKMLNLLSIDAR
jgi:predicted negative regulator of RcsB-dependent stress response